MLLLDAFLSGRCIYRSFLFIELNTEKRKNMQDIFIQTIGFFGLLSAVISYQCKTNRNYFVWQGLCGIFFSLQFVLMGAWAGLLFNAFNIVRAFLLRLSKISRSLWMIFSMEAYVAAATLLSIFLLKETWWLVVFVFVAQAAGTLAMWTKNGRIIRFAQLFVISPFWLLYDALIPTPSFGGVLCEVFNMTSVIVSFIRFRKTGFDQT